MRVKKIFRRPTMVGDIFFRNLCRGCSKTWLRPWKDKSNIMHIFWTGRSCWYVKFVTVIFDVILWYLVHFTFMYEIGNYILFWTVWILGFWINSIEYQLLKSMNFNFNVRNTVDEALEKVQGAANEFLEHSCRISLTIHP